MFSFPFLFTHFADVYGSTKDLYGILQCGLTIAVFQFGWAATQVSHLALIPQLTPIDSERTDLSALRSVGFYTEQSFTIGEVQYRFSESNGV